MTLLEYLQADPDELGLAALITAGSDGTIAELLNEPRFNNGSFISRDALEVALIGLGIPAKCKLATITSGTPAPLFVAAQTVLDLLASSRFPQVNLTDASVVAMMDGLVAGGILTTQERAGITAKATTHIYSVAEREGWTITAGLISETLLPLRPGGIVGGGS